jgi:hypothetical protein
MTPPPSAPQHRKPQLLAEADAAAHVLDRDLLRGGHHHGAIRILDELYHCERLVTRAGRGIDDQVVERAPFNVRKQLFDGAEFPRSAPDDRVVRLAQQETNRHDAELAVAAAHLHRKHGVRVRRDLASVEMQELGDARTVEVDVENADPFSRQGQGRGEMDRNGALADATLAGKHQDLVLDTAHPRAQELALEELLVALVGALLLRRAL